MLHRCLLAGVLSRMDAGRVTYFGEVADLLEADPRTERFPNLVFMVLREACPFLPTYLPKADLAERVLAFANANEGPLRRLLYGAAFARDPHSLRRITDGLVREVVGEALERHETGRLTEEGRGVLTFRWPYTDTDFPDDEIA